MLNEIVIFCEDGVWNYATVVGSGPLVAAGAEEGYDSYTTVLSAVTREFPGALIAVPTKLTLVDPALVAADVQGVAG